MWSQIVSELIADFTDHRKYSQIILLAGIFVLISLLYNFAIHRAKKLPPGPVGLPIFGYYLSLGRRPEKTLNDLARKYGSIFGLYLGPQYVVFINDWEALKEAAVSTLDRPPSLFADVPFKLGVNGNNGTEWVQSRRLSSRAIKDIGLHNDYWEELVQTEAMELAKGILEQGESPVEVRRFFSYGFANNVVTLLLGERIDSGNSVTRTVAESVDAILEYSPTLGMMNFSPILSRVLQALGLEKEYLLSQTMNEFGEFISNIVDEMKQNPTSETNHTFTAHFQDDLEKQRKNNKEKNYVTDDTLKGTVVAFLAGGSETSRCTIIWTLIAMAKNPDKQAMVHQELDRVIGREGTVRWSDRARIPYTYATLMESMRWATVVPFTTMRIANEDLKIQGYHIPKGTFLTINSYSVHNDPKYWRDPEQFAPERFLLEDGQRVNTTPDSFNPFSYCKRNCPGKLLAHMAVLQYFCILMQKFKVKPKDGDRVEHGVVLGLTYQASDVELRFIPRQSKQ